MFTKTESLNTDKVESNVTAVIEELKRSKKKGFIARLIQSPINFSMDMLLNTYSKRKIVLSSMVGYFLKVDALDLQNMTRLNKLMNICDYSPEAMRLPIMFSNSIWNGIDVEQIQLMDTPEAIEYLKAQLPKWLIYDDMDKDLKMFLNRMRNHSFQFLTVGSPI